MKNKISLCCITLCYCALFYYSLFSFSPISLIGALIKATISGITVVLVLSLIKNAKFKYAVATLFSINFAILFYVALMYGRFTSGMFASVLESNNAEALAHLNSLDLKLLLLTLLPSALFLWACLKVSASKKLIPYFAILCLCISVVAATEIKSHGIKGTRVTETRYRADGEELLINLFSANANTLILASLYEYLSLSNIEASLTPSRWSNVKRVSPEKDIYLVVIGESANRDRFALYGYNRATTDALSDTQHITIVSDPIAASVVTRTSLPRSFNVNTVDTIDYGLNIIELANQVGSQTYWISNQGVVGNHDTPITAIAKHSQQQRFLNSNYELAQSDLVFKAELANILKDNDQTEKQSKVIFLHTMGSHNDFCDRIIDMPLRLPESERPRAQECYDNSILNTYHLLTELKAQLDESNLSYKMLYFSDHGLVTTKHSPYLSHGSGKLFSRQALEVPLMFISQQALAPEQNKQIKARYYMSDFPHTFADWIGVSADQIDLKRSILSPEFDAALQPEKVFDDSFNVRQLK